MMIKALFFLITLFSIVGCTEQIENSKSFNKEINHISNFEFISILGMKNGDESELFSIANCGYALGPFKANDFFIESWIESNSNAKVQVIKRFNSGTEKISYVWVFGENDTLNIELVKYGYYPGAFMLFTDSYDSLISNSGELTEVFISEMEYNKWYNRLRVVERFAIENKLGIWSNEIDTTWKYYGKIKQFQLK